jgi:uncharacterized protein (DUF952 family)
MQNIVFKIAAVDEWSKATTAGIYDGSRDDRRDGFVHLSTWQQLPGTLEKHFKGNGDLVLIAFEASKLGPALKWEQSRGGELFPHLYAALPTSAALWQRTLVRDTRGVPQINEEWCPC